MKCQICERKQVEYIGIICGKHRVCMHCIHNLVEKEIKHKHRTMRYSKKGGK